MKLRCQRQILSFLSIFSGLVFASRAHAVLAFEITPQEVDRIVVVGLEAQVQLQGMPGAAKLRVTGLGETSEAGQFVLERKDRTLWIKMQEYSDKKDWKEALAKPFGKRKIIDFTGAAVPVEVQLRDGIVNAQKWSREIRVALVKGKVISAGGTAALSLQIQNGQAVIQDQTSKVTANIYKGVLDIKNLQGDLDGSVFSGALQVEKSRGFLQINTAQSTAKIIECAGTLQFENLKGAVITQKFAGRVDGQTTEGGVSLGILADTDVHVKSQTGRVSVLTAAGSGALLNLTTAEGEIIAPSEVKVNRTATEKTVRGRLRGGEQKGSIVVRSQEGNITIK
jgi:hypothetical protein